MTLAACKRCSESKYADGSSIRYTSAGFPRHNANATLCNSPPDKFCTCLQIKTNKHECFVHFSQISVYNGNIYSKKNYQLAIFQ